MVFLLKFSIQLKAFYQRFLDNLFRVLHFFSSFSITEIYET